VYGPGDRKMKTLVKTKKMYEHKETGTSEEEFATQLNYMNPETQKLIITSVYNEYTATLLKVEWLEEKIIMTIEYENGSYDQMIAFMKRTWTKMKMTKIIEGITLGKTSNRVIEKIETGIEVEDPTKYIIDNRT
jgi:hypothetical protein